MSGSTMEIYEKGLACLIEKLGVVQTERFITVVKRENFDYTKWQREYFDKMPEGEFTKAAAEYARNNEYTGTGEEI